MKMRLQLALDAAKHFALLPVLASYFDIVEVGTPLLKRFGVAAITTARDLSNGRPTLADTKPSTVVASKPSWSSALARSGRPCWLAHRR
jgi:3-keto-L-gulonate-6-phosphate decarboxylase